MVGGSFRVFWLLPPLNLVSISITYFSSATKFLILLKKKNIEIIKTLGTDFDSSRDITLYAWLMI
jgi:hypothetical protein